MTPIATLILTAIDLADELYRRKQDADGTHRTLRVKANLDYFRHCLSEAVAQGTDVTPDEIEFWNDRIKQDRQTLKSIAEKNDPPEQP